MTSTTPQAVTDGAAEPTAAPAPTGDQDVVRGFAASWLRANCPCAVCVDPGSGQRLVSVTDLPEDVSVSHVSVSQVGVSQVGVSQSGEAGDDVAITFGPDGHRAVFSRSWLAGQSEPVADERTEDAKRLWTASDFASGPPRWAWPDYLASDVARADCIATILRDGFALLGDVPREPETVLAVARSMGYVRETNYGRLFDVRVAATPSNLAFTGLPIAPHTDNPYRDPVPTVQLLHCLDSGVTGGDSGLVDGFAAASLLRDEDPAAFGVLTSTAVTFAYADATAELTATRPMIGLDPAGRIREIRFNNRSIQPWRPRRGATGTNPASTDRAGAGPASTDPASTDPASTDPAGTEAAGDAFYAAYRAFAHILVRPELLLTFRLAPGDCMIFDNTRVLHARTGFAATGRRHLQGCYADLDGMSSTLALLRRRPAA